MTVVKTQRTKKQIGAEIKRLRKSYNMTQVKLGMILNIDSTKISKIESGTESSLDAFLLMEICEIFDTSLDRLCYTTVEDEAEIDASEAFNIILNAEYTERKTVMKMLRAI